MTRPRTQKLRLRWIVIPAVVLVLVVGILVAAWRPLAVAGSTGRPTPQWSGGPTESALDFRPVTAARPGACPPGPAKTTIWSSPADECYSLGTGGLTVSQLKSAAVVQDQTGSWNVRLTFDPADARAFASLTKTFVAQQFPRNQMAIIIDDPHGAELLSAPAVVQSYSGPVDLSVGQTQAQATALLDRIRG